jgi:hypothetical protein
MDFKFSIIYHITLCQECRKKLLVTQSGNQQLTLIENNELAAAAR